MRKIYFAAILLVVPMVAVSLAQDVDDPVDPEGTVTEPVLNENQAARVQRLSEVSGVTEEEILQMRMRTPVSEDPTVTEPTDTTGPQGRGWGLIAQMLGLHPGILGNGTGDKFLPPEDETSLLAARHSMRKKRLFGETEGDDLDDGSLGGKKNNGGGVGNSGLKNNNSRGKGQDKSNRGKSEGKGKGKNK